MAAFHVDGVIKIRFDVGGVGHMACLSLCIMRKYYHSCVCWRTQNMPIFKVKLTLVKL